MGFGDVLDVSFQVFRTAFWQLAIVQAIVAVPVAVLQFLLISGPMPGTLNMSIILARLPDTLVVGLLGVLQMGAAVTIIGRAMAGARLDPWEAYRQAAARFPQLLGFAIVYVVLVTVGGALLVVPGVLAAVWLSQGVFLVVLDRQDVFAAVRQSYRLVTGFFWRVLGIALAAGLLVMVVGFVVSTLTTAMVFVGGMRVTVPITQTAFTVFVGSFPLVALYVQHVDLRRRKDFDGPEALGD